MNNINMQDVLLILDGLAAGINMEGVASYMLGRNQGYNELAHILHQRDVVTNGYKVVILIIGRGDVWEKR